MLRKLSTHSVSAAAHALLAALPQLLALIVLPLSDYGAFSIAYLVYAWALSLGLSLVMEPWSRSGASTDETTRAGFNGLLLVLAASAGCVVGVLTAVAFRGPMAVVSSVSAVAGYLVWAGVRYMQIVRGRVLVVAIMETLAVAAMLLTALVGFVFLPSVTPTTAFFATWGAPGCFLLVGGVVLQVHVLGNPLRWARDMRNQIATLLPDSLLMDLGAIGVPMGLAPVLGGGGIAVYRAIANASFPGRILISALRPNVHRISRARWRSFRFHAFVVVGSALIAAGIVLTIKLAASLIGAAVLLELSGRPWQVLLFSIANFYSSVLYVGSRSICSGGSLMTGRLIHTMLAIVFPVLGVFAFGLEGAVWGLVVSVLGASAVWAAVIVWSARDQNSMAGLVTR